jgi:hypothetical protein
MCDFSRLDDFRWLGDILTFGKVRK